MDYRISLTPKQREVVALSCRLYSSVLRGDINETFRNLPYTEGFNEDYVFHIKNLLRGMLPEVLVDGIDGVETFLPPDHPSLGQEVETCHLIMKLSHPVSEGGHSLITGVEAQVISKACDVYARTLMGQVHESVDNLPLKSGVDYDKVWGIKKSLRPLLSHVLIHGVDGWSSSLGVGSPDLHPNSNIAVDIHNVIRHKMSWENAVKAGIIESENSPRKWPEMLTVNYDDPFHWGSEPLCTLTRT